MGLATSIAGGGATGTGGGGTGSSKVSNSAAFTQAAHGFSVGNAVYFDGTWHKAKADATTTLCEGIVVEVADVDNFTVYVPGGQFVTITAHGLGAAGSPLYLSASSAGALTTSVPAGGNYTQTLGQIIDANTIALQSFSAEPS